MLAFREFDQGLKRCEISRETRCHSTPTIIEQSAAGRSSTQYKICETPTPLGLSPNGAQYTPNHPKALQSGIAYHPPVSNQRKLWTRRIAPPRKLSKAKG